MSSVSSSSHPFNNVPPSLKDLPSSDDALVKAMANRRSLDWQKSEKLFECIVRCINRKVADGETECIIDKLYSERSRLAPFHKNLLQSKGYNVKDSIDRITVNFGLPEKQ